MGNSNQLPGIGDASLQISAEDRLRLIEENVRDYAIFIVDLQGRIASWNRGAERILGYKHEEAIGLECATLFTPEDRAKGVVEAMIQQAGEAGRAEDERWHLRKDGSRFWCNGVLTGLRDEAGQLRGYVKILRNETVRKRAMEESERAHERRLEQERQSAVLAERNRLAQEIHDTLAQCFTGIHIQLEAAGDALPEGQADSHFHIRKAQDLALEGLNEARRSVWALRPQVLTHGGFVNAFARLAEETRHGTSLAVHCQIEGGGALLPENVEDHLLRISQEAVVNVLRHSGATELRLSLHIAPDAVQLRVQDNGRGFAPSGSGSGFGLTTMRQRTESLGGVWSLTTAPGQGTTIEVTVPLAAT